jgi:single-strand DNA-binding protein
VAGDTVITVVGNLTADPELRFTRPERPVANFTVASTPRTFDKNSNEWKDGEALFLRCSVWRQAAENVAESLHKGSAVIVQGRLKQRSYEKEGEKRTVYELDVEEVGPSLKWATAKVTKASRGGGGGGGFGGGGGGGGQSYGGGNSGGSSSSNDDPWASSAPSGGAAASGGWSDEPPF